MGFWDKAKKAAKIAEKIGKTILDEADKQATKNASKMSDSELKTKSGKYAQAEMKKRGL